jgi:thiamine biosynthesis protein ThiS
MKTIHLNGKSTDTSAVSVADLVAELGFSKGTVLVELNGTALRPDEWTKTLNQADAVELLRIVAGG